MLASVTGTGQKAQSTILATDLVKVFGLSSSMMGQNTAWHSQKNKDLGVREAKFKLNSILPLTSSVSLGKEFYL